MYFPDLTRFEYGREEPRSDVLNVGWLSIDHPFTKGSPSDELVDALEVLMEDPVNLFRGKHYCEFCPPPPKKLSPGGLLFNDPLPGTAGNGEIRVIGSDGIMYVAPVMIHHYVSVHRYLPPQEFIEAVFRTIANLDDETRFEGCRREWEGV